MPALANHLGAGVMSIYWYFRNKDELLVAMADRALEQVYSGLPQPGGQLVPRGPCHLGFEVHHVDRAYVAELDGSHADER